MTAHRLRESRDWRRPAASGDGDHTDIACDRRRYDGTSYDARKDGCVFGQKADSHSGGDHRQNPVFAIALI